ncbi:MAG: class I SAM-dependent rRNA methyltransferase [Candidatus Aminicenantes bacterium]|nr:class I SAM-dependent rRNA methyltransferase [Candidatus Aminicenantes bacterium]
MKRFSPTSQQAGVVLKKGREQSVLNHHHWIFSGAIASYPENFQDGEIYPVFSFEGQLLGYGYFNRRCSLAGRLLSFGQAEPYTTLEDNLRQAVELRKKVYPEAEAVRLVNGESDHLPGLIVDRYGPGLVLQVSTLGLEKLKPLLIEQLINLLRPVFIYEKSSLPSRREEGLPDFEGLLYGELNEPILVTENGLKFKIFISQAQKTGFFLDQRQMRELVGQMTKGFKVLDCFSYTGGFALAALKGGAREVELVDYSRKALEVARENMLLNGFGKEHFRIINEDMFSFLEAQKSLSHDLVILDPPAFAKKKTDLKKALKAYRRLNALTMSRMKRGSFLLTFSCSYYVETSLFQKIIFQAALEANREARIIQRHRMSFDHPVNVFHPESDYLKGLLLYLS